MAAWPRTFSRVFGRLGMTLGLLLIFAAPAAAAPESLKLNDGTEIPLRVYSARGDTQVLWLACDEGHGTREALSSWNLATGGIEAWLPDYLGGHFLPVAPSSMEQVSGEEVAALIDLALASSNKKIYLVSAGRGALPTLLGIRAWQEKHPGRGGPQGAILFYPELYAATPAPGAEAQYHPVVIHTSVPVFVYQGQRSPGRWWLEHLRAALESGGSKVRSEILPGVRGYFFVRQDSSPAEEAMAKTLPELIRKAMKSIDEINGVQP